MKKMSSIEIRKMWLEFFKNKDHEIIFSKSLVPIDDSSLLWINSGVATLKDYFTGKKMPKNPRIANSQKSLRTNDIENVGVTSRHHTLFEMLGNFSIGNYFRNEALDYAFELLFDFFEFDKEKVYFTYFEDDKETYDKWISLGINPDNLIKGTRKTNFWDVGQGPCGPCTEIFYDRGEKYDFQKNGLKLLKEDIENDRYIEIWNIVFSQFNNDGKNNYEELKQKNIDTGAGLERLASISQDVPTNFDTDLFQPLIKKVEDLTKSKYDIENYFKKNYEQEKINKNFRIIADHIRAVALAIEDGVKPSNTKRGYIIRRLIRRAYRSFLLLGTDDNAFLYKLIPIVAEIMSIFNLSVEKIASIVKNEELTFAKTILDGQNLLNLEILKIAKINGFKKIVENSSNSFNKINENLSEVFQQNHQYNKKFLNEIKFYTQNKKFDFSIAFKLFETYGFPIELTQEILEEYGIMLDLSEFDHFKNKHANISRNQKIKGMDYQVQIIQSIDSCVSEFVGYSELETNSRVIFRGKENEKYFLLLDKTPFFTTSGGQSKDLGTIDGFRVIDVFKDKYNNSWHVLENEIINDNVFAIVDKKSRLAKERNHSATHLLGEALRQIFGNSIVQLGSEHNENKLRFDFPLENRPSKIQLQSVENLVNSFIKNSFERKYIVTSIQEAKNMNAIFMENEEYFEKVRVVKFGNLVELCGGTHVNNTSEIEEFKIIKFESKGHGIFRIEAITSKKDVKSFIDNEIFILKSELRKIIFKNQKIDPNYNLFIPNTILELEKSIEIAKSHNKELNKKNTSILMNDDIKFESFKNMDTYINLNFKDVSVLKNNAIILREKYPNKLIILGSKKNNRTTLVIASNIYNSKKVFDDIVLNMNSNGGGNARFAMGSCDLIEELNA